MATAEIGTVALTRLSSWRHLLAQCMLAVLLFAVANVYTYEASGFFERDAEYAQQVSAVATHPNVRILFAGDSHFGVPLNDYLNPNPAGPAYSVASGGDSLRECFAKVRSVLNTTHTIDTLILTADPHMFGSGRLNSSNRSFADRYFIEAWDASGVPQHNLWSAMLQQVPLFNEDFLQYFRKDMSVLLKRSPAHARAEGDPLEWSRLTDTQRTRAAIATGRGDHAGIGASQQPFVWYRRILDLARERHLQVIGVRFPVHSEYSGQVSPAQVAEIDSFLLSHGVSRIIDLRTGLTDPKYFQDEDHVNELGVAPLVDMLEQRLGRKLR
jgi:hypothetical protein